LLALRAKQIRAHAGGLNSLNSKSLSASLKIALRSPRIPITQFASTANAEGVRDSVLKIIKIMGLEQ
jgi:hypothetical protein